MRRQWLNAKACFEVFAFVCRSRTSFGRKKGLKFVSPLSQSKFHQNKTLKLNYL
jgi:hypothetical protein